LLLTVLDLDIIPLQMRFVKLSLFILALHFLVAPQAAPAQLKGKMLGYRVEQVQVGDKFVYTILETGPAGGGPGRRKPITKRSTLIERVIATDATYEQKSGARKLLRDTITGESVYVLETPGVGFSIKSMSHLPCRRCEAQVNGRRIRCSSRRADRSSCPRVSRSSISAHRNPSRRRRAR
jgi:hypothetical protein